MATGGDISSSSSAPSGQSTECLCARPIEDGEPECKRRRELIEHPSDELLKLADEQVLNEIAKNYLEKTVKAFEAGHIVSPGPNQAQFAEFNFRKFVAVMADKFKNNCWDKVFSASLRRQGFLESLPVLSNGAIVLGYLAQRSNFVVYGPVS